MSLLHVTYFSAVEIQDGLLAIEDLTKSVSSQQNLAHFGALQV